MLRALGTDKIDLIIASFPDITFDADDTPDLPTNPDQIAEWTSTWPELEALHDAGTIARLGIAEFGAQKLQALLDNTRVKPEVDQINVRDCCVVPKPLIVFTKERGLDLLTHNDCTEVLPEENLRELMTEFGLPSDGVRPRWVVKYTAVLKNKRVVENKGYVETTHPEDEEKVTNPRVIDTLRWRRLPNSTAGSEKQKRCRELFSWFRSSLVSGVKSVRVGVCLLAIS